MLCLENAEDNLKWVKKIQLFKVPSSVTRLGDFFHFGQLFKAYGNN